MEDKIMAKLTTAEFIEAIKELSVLELNELVKACEEEFGVSAAAGVVVAAAGAGEAAEEKDEFDVELTGAGASKVKVIKIVREITGLGLKEAKALEVVAGVVEGTVYDAAGCAELSQIPGREELLSKLLGSLQSPITNLARVLNQIAEQNGAPAEAVAEEAPAEA